MNKYINIFIILLFISSSLMAREYLPLKLKNGSKNIFPSLPEVYLREEREEGKKIEERLIKFEEELINIPYRKSDILKLEIEEEKEIRASFFSLRNDKAPLIDYLPERDIRISLPFPEKKSITPKFLLPPKKELSIWEEIDQKYHRLLDSFIKKINREMAKIEKKSRGLKRILDKIDAEVTNLIEKTKEAKAEEVTTVSIHEPLKEIEIEERLTPEIKEDLPEKLRERVESRIRINRDAGYQKWRDKVRFISIIKKLFYALAIITLGISSYLWIRKRRKAKRTDKFYKQKAPQVTESNLEIKNKIDDLKILYQKTVGNLDEKVTRQIQNIEMKEKNIEEKIAQINEKISRLDSKVERVKEEGRKILEDKKTSKPERKSAKKKKRVEEERELFYSQIYEYYKSGLDPEEIAKLTNMSVSEIELILELKEDG